MTNYRSQSCQVINISLLTELPDYFVHQEPERQTAFLKCVVGRRIQIVSWIDRDQIQKFVKIIGGGGGEGGT